MSKKRVVVGMSGGVDSSVAAYLLKKQGYDVIGVTMRIWQDEDDENISSNGGCCGLSAVDDARRVAKALDIPYYVMNFKDEFQNKVIDYFVDEYLAGRTPNPCIACNRYIKWESLLKRSMDIGADYIATGHYAKVVKLDNGRYTLETAGDKKKDQTYALYNLSQYQLSKTLMPVGDYEKSEIRKIASEFNLRVANKPDSQEICFIPDHDHAKFIKKERNIDIEKGNFVDLDGNVLGKHEGIVKYTVGQRKGLGISLGKPMFVKSINVDNNEVVLCDGDDLFTKVLYADDLNYMSIEGLKSGESIRAKGKIRYSHQGEYCTVTGLENGKIRVDFDKEVRAVTPGQSFVFYDDDDRIIGGGTII